MGDEKFALVLVDFEAGKAMVELCESREDAEDRRALFLQDYPLSKHGWAIIEKGEDV